MSRTFAAIVILAAALVLGKLYLNRSTTPAAGPDAAVPPAARTTLPSQATLAELKADLAALQRQAARDRARLDRALSDPDRGNAAAPEADPVVASAPPDVDPAREETAAERGLAEARAFAAGLERRMDLDGGVAPDWAGDAVRSRLAERGIADTALTHSRCTTNLCRLDFQFDNEDARDALLMNIGESLPDAEGFFLSDPSAPLVTRVYVAPQGSALAQTSEG